MSRKVQPRIRGSRCFALHIKKFSWSRVAHWYVICFRSWRSHVQTLIKTKYVMIYLWSLIRSMHKQLCVSFEPQRYEFPFQTRKRLLNLDNKFSSANVCAWITRSWNTRLTKEPGRFPLKYQHCLLNRNSNIIERYNICKNVTLSVYVNLGQLGPSPFLFLPFLWQKLVSLPL